MALRRTLAQRLLSESRGPKATMTTPIPTNPAKMSPRRDYSTDSAGRGFFRRFLQRRDINQAAESARLPEFLTLPVGDRLKEKLRTTIGEFGGERIRLNGLAPPAPLPETFPVGRVSVEVARKILRLAQVEKVKERVKEIPKNSIPYSEFVRICSDCVSNHDQGAEYAKMMDQSGNVIVLGNVVFLRPEQVAKSMEAILSQSVATPDDPRIEELEQMEKHKASIDKKARAQVRGELYCGLGLLAAQTAGFARLTFWELSWDVMEPICFFVTSLHFAAAYAFFLRTAVEPSFEGYFRRRFRSKQRRLMESQSFDVGRFEELRRVCYPDNFRRESDVFSPPDVAEGRFAGAVGR